MRACSARIALAAAVLVAAAGGAVLLASRPPAAQLQIDPVEFRKARFMDDLMTARGAIGGPFTLTDTAGARRSLSDYRGKLVLLYFGYMFCPDVCPTDLVAVKGLLAALGPRADEVQPIFVTVDPERDTRDLLAAWLPHFNSRILGLTGTVDEVRAVADSYRAYFEKVPAPNGSHYFIDHSANLYLIDREGRYLGYFPPGTHPERLLDVLRDYL